MLTYEVTLVEPVGRTVVHVTAEHVYSRQEAEDWAAMYVLCNGGAGMGYEVVASYRVDDDWANA